MQKTLNTTVVWNSSRKAGGGRSAEEEQMNDLVVAVPSPHPPSLDDFCPTDEEITETERLDVSETVVESPVTPPKLHGQLDFLECVHDDNNDADSSSSSTSDTLLPLSELIDRLALVNAEITTTPLRKHKDLTIEEMTNILKHINLCDAMQTHPRWDLIDEMAYYEQQVEDDDEEEEESGQLLESSSCSKITATSSTMAVISPTIVMDHDDHDHDGFLLKDAVSHSCSSSVTWYEGSMIEEVELSDNELQEILNYRYESSSGEFCISAKERCEEDDESSVDTIS